MSNNDKAKIFYHEIMVVWHNTVLQCDKNGRGQVNIFWHVLRAVYCLLGPKILVTPLDGTHNNTVLHSVVVLTTLYMY